jgi:uncharacterized protein YbcI
MRCLAVPLDSGPPPLGSGGTLNRHPRALTTPRPRASSRSIGSRSPGCAPSLVRRRPVEPKHGEEVDVCFLANALTPVERTLGTLDEHQRLRDIRMLFQYAAEPEFRGAIEQITGRKVIAFVSGIDTRAHVASELFTLEPRSLDGAAERAKFARRRNAVEGGPLLIFPVDGGVDLQPIPTPGP